MSDVLTVLFWINVVIVFGLVLGYLYISVKYPVDWDSPNWSQQSELREAKREPIWDAIVFFGITFFVLSLVAPF